MDDERVCSDERRAGNLVYGVVRVGCFGVLLGADEPEGDGLDNNAVQRVRVEHGDGTSSYQLRSLGFDGTVSDDDLCVAGQTTRARQLLKAATTVAASLLNRLTGKAVSFGDKIAAVREMRCADSS